MRKPWRCHLDAKISSQNAPVATGWLLRHVWLLNTIETQHGFLLVYTCLAFFLINIFSPFQFFQKHNGFTTKCRGSSLEESAMGLGNFTTNCLALESPFFGAPAFFSTKWLAIQSWSGPWTFSQGGLTTKWPIKTHIVVALRPPILYGKFEGGSFFHLCHSWSIFFAPCSNPLISKKNALHYKNPWKRSLGSIYLQNVLLDPILSLITKCRAQGFGKCITSSTRNYDIRFPLYKKVCVRNVPHKELGLLQKGVFRNGLEALHLVEDI